MGVDVDGRGILGCGGEEGGERGGDCPGGVLGVFGEEGLYRFVSWDFPLLSGLYEESGDVQDEIDVIKEQTRDQSLEKDGERWKRLGGNKRDIISSGRFPMA